MHGGGEFPPDCQILRDMGELYQPTGHIGLMHQKRKGLIGHSPFTWRLRVGLPSVVEWTVTRSKTGCMGHSARNKLDGLLSG